MKNLTIISEIKNKLVQIGTLKSNENIYTKNVWRKKGYKVSKGENPIAIIPIYIYVPHKVYDKDGNCTKVCKMLNVKASFYKISQVSPIQKGA
ncbi:MAG: hypothetical protein UD936_00110 [Acutalibacteraceae bacterium]|nr:hypothetical protein [Acutalibacteraceae bacterium]